MRHLFAVMSVLMLTIGLFLMLLTVGNERTTALLCMLISAVLATGAGVMGASERLRADVAQRGAAQAPVNADPHRAPPTT